MRHGSLFSGAGGMDAGFERAGFTTLWQVEADPAARAVLRKHWPYAQQYPDVRGVRGADLPPVDVLSFGSPCQDLSLAGNRKGLGGERSGLFYEAIRVATELKQATQERYPRYVVWENVVGALISNSGRDFYAVLRAMAGLGALDIGWRVLDAAEYGVPQRRRRVFVVADTGGQCAGKILADAHYERTDTTTRPGQGQNAYAGTDSGTGDERWHAGRDTVTTLLTDGGGVCVAEAQAGHIAYSLAAGARRLTPLEYERLMGWDDDWTRWTDTGEELTDTFRYRACGNGVVTTVAHAIARELATTL